LYSDHIISPILDFKKQVNYWLKQKNHWITIFWIKPLKPETWYWYIKKVDEKAKFSKVDKFFEKPNLQKAWEYIKNKYLWNSWMSLICWEKFVDLLKKVNPKMKKLIFDSDLSDKEIFNEIDAVSLENWLIEKIDNVFCIDLEIYWTDLWSFDSINEYCLEQKIENKNIINEWKSEDNFVLTEKKDKEICLVDIKDLVIVDTEDVLLISKKWSTQKVKKIVKKSNKNVSILQYRPWWSYKVIAEWKWFKTKIVTVLPGKKLWTHIHHHRTESWVIAEWTWKVFVEDKEKIISKWESIYIPIWQKHILENPWLIPLRIIETQIWDYLGEDDIKRF